MFSALKFIAAGVIVALFGGFLLAGVLTTQQGDEMAPAAVTESPSPMTSEELLAGMVTEEVEPGVFRVVNDGVRDLASPGMPWRERQEFWYRDHALVAGRDGSVWLLWPEGFYRLGDPETHTSFWGGDEGRGGAILDAEGALDGTLWVVGDSGLFAFDGTQWRDQSNEGVSIWGVDSAPDGAVWSVYPRDVDDHVIARFDGAAWTLTEVQSGVHRLEPAITDDGDLYVQAYFGYESYPSGPFERVREGQPLMDIDRLTEATDVPIWSEAAIGADGTQWVRVLEEIGSSEDPSTNLVRIVGDEVTEYPNAPLSQHRISVAPDGSAWLRLRQGSTGTDDDCNGVARFDGEATRRYLRHMCIHDIDFSPDGAVWLQARLPYAGGPRPLVYTYVITPEAVAG